MQMGDTCLHAAVARYEAAVPAYACVLHLLFRGKLDAVKMLVDNYGADKEARNSTGDRSTDIARQQIQPWRITALLTAITEG